ncbi:MAG TPA: type II toxin-antitoxin system VapB family antitoxin [Bryobacteraceae bacterium]|nr:type II toxin-antitoxin system VapB family antitoxin [Bryobacteraceae bacterium]
MAAINIKDPETYRLARELSRRTGKSITQAVRESLRRSLELEGVDQRAERRLVDRVMVIARRASARPILDPRTPEEIVGYDEVGVPR